MAKTNTATRRIAPGVYHIESRFGTFEIANPRTAWGLGRSSWMITFPGEDRPSDGTETLREAKESVLYAIDNPKDYGLVEAKVAS